MSLFVLVAVVYFNMFCKMSIQKACVMMIAALVLFLFLLLFLLFL